MKIISSRDREIQFPWEPDLLEWLQEKYPVSGYFLYEEDFSTTLNRSSVGIKEDGN